jgi:hypothetical protein
MATKRTYREIASRRPGGALGAAIARGEKAARTLARDPKSRAALQALGERPERLGPPATDR